MKQYYHELISLTQLFLFREYPLPKIPSLLPIKKEEEKPSPPSSPTLSSVKSIPQPPLPSSPPPSLVSTASPEPLIVEKAKEKTKKWELEPLKTPLSSLEVEALWTTFSPLFPHIRLSKSIPSDHEARQLKNRWLNEQEVAILILSFGEEENLTAFLKKMAQGISERLAAARVLPVSRVKKEEEWQRIFTSPSLRFIIASDYALYMHPQLMRYYREQPQQRKYFLFDKPLLLLSDLSLYLKEPPLKALLWKTICHAFASTSDSL